MEKVKKIINSISWVIVALTGILLIVKWNGECETFSVNNVLEGLLW